MKYFRNVFISILFIFGLTSLSSIANAECGKITIADWNWASGSLMANVDKVILENGYGCEVELVPGATMPTFPSDFCRALWLGCLIILLLKSRRLG